jgi:hypothetical protein
VSSAASGGGTGASSAAASSSSAAATRAARSVIGSVWPVRLGSRGSGASDSDWVATGAGGTGGGDGGGRELRAPVGRAGGDLEGAHGRRRQLQQRLQHLERAVDGRAVARLLAGHHVERGLQDELLVGAGVAHRGQVDRELLQQLGQALVDVLADAEQERGGAR